MKSSSVYQENGLTFTEIVRQDYTGNNCVISGGFVEGNDKPAVDEIYYLKLQKDGVEPTLILLRPDEMQIISWIATGVMWSYLMSKKAPD